MFTQRRQRIIVAGVKGQYMGLVVKSDGESAL